MVTLVVHGHFYQPPRENPWTEEVSRQPSAAPFHDWNERVTAECYRPNAFARILDERGRVVAVVDNYSRLSFDVGPTLLSWLQQHEPLVYSRIIAAGSAGGAIAQAFGHVILPLANDRDRHTQIRWGLADFEHRFGRHAAGMWLPEAAVDDATLAALVEEGVGFTILAPSQAGRTRPGPDADWVDTAAAPIDSRRSYRWLHPDGSGRGIDIVFYNNDLSHRVAFDLGAMSSQSFIDRVVEAAGHDGGLVLVATDGETFGHHFRWGDRLLAYALAVEAPRRGVEVTDLATWLASPSSGPRHEVEVRESSWSCAHGVERWRTDCGCATGGQPSWQQRWRAPLRSALDQLREFAVRVFAERGPTVLKDPWAARDAYVRLLLNAVSRDEFAAEWVTGDPVVAFTLLETQRSAMAMYTSCGWFFNDLSGIETIQVLRYAAHVMDLLQQIDEEPPEAEFLEELSKAESNNPHEGDGRTIWRTHVEPERVGAARVAAHLALLDLLEGFPGGQPPARLAAFDVDVLEHERRDRAPISLCAGRVAIRHLRTGRRTERAYAAILLGGLEVLGASRPADARRDPNTAGLLIEAFDKGAPVTTLLRMMTDGFGPREFGLAAALPDGAEQILGRTASALEDRFAAVWDQLFEDNRAMLEAMSAHGEPLPAALRLPGELALARRLDTEVARQGGSSDPSSYRRAVGIAHQARAAGLELDTPRTRALLEQLILDSVTEAVGALAAARSGLAADPEGPAERALGLVALSADLGVGLNTDRAQELLYDALVPEVATQGAPPTFSLLAVALGLAVEQLGVHPIG
jgi:alpha-amylase/alpha-mannosidase (GH57 family)